MLQDVREALSDTVQDSGAPEVLRERCEYIYRRVLPAIAATAVLSLLLSAFLWRLRPPDLILFWQGMMLLLAAGFWGLAEAYRRSPAAPARPGLWGRRAALGPPTPGAAPGLAA